MKKLIILLSLILICSISYGQAKINRAGPANTVVDQNLNAANSFILPVVADTSAANLLTSLDSCGKLIYARDVAAIFFRACTGYSSRVWIQIMPSGGTGGLRPWLIGGQGGLFTSPVDAQIIGVTTNQPFGFMTNNVNRVIVPAAGLSLLTLQSDTTLNKPMTYNTSTKEWNYGYWFGSGSGSSGWSLTGNAGLTAGTNFVGTTDDVDLVFKRNSVESGRFSSSGNLNLGLTGTTLGSLGLSGNTSGLITVKGQAAAGTYNFNLPTTAGTSGYLLTSAGGGGSPMTWTDPAAYTAVPTWQQTLTAGSTLTGTNTIDADGNDLTFTGNATYIVDNAFGSEIKLEGTFARLIGHGATDRLSEIVVDGNAIEISPSLGVLNIDTLNYSGNSDDSMMVWRPSTGRVGMRAIPSGGATTWNAITSPTGDQALTFDAGESSTWTDANTTEDLFTVNSSTGTTNSMFSLNRTGTALASGNNILELVSSGANGTNAITATGARISVTNTNATSGTNVGLAVTATGATTANYAIQATGAMTLTAAAQTPASFSSSFAGNMQVNWNSTTGNNVNFVFQDAGTARWYIGNNSATGSDRLHILNASAAEAVTVLQGLQVGINQTAPTARLHIGAGAATASYAPFKLTTGTSNTVAEAGAMEYTTPQLFFTNGRAVRQEIFQGQQARVSTQYDNTTTTLGNVTGLTVNVAASGTYRFTAKLFTTSDVAGGIKVAVGGTATATSIRYEGLTTDAGLTTQGRATALGTAVGAVTAVTAAFVTIEGLIVVSNAGTLTIQAAANAATGTTSVLTGSTFVVTEML